MKLIIEMEMDDDVRFKPGTKKSAMIKLMDRHICGAINDAMLSARLDHVEYIVEYKGKRWIDYMNDCKVIDVIEYDEDME